MRKGACRRPGRRALGWRLGAWARGRSGAGARAGRAGAWSLGRRRRGCHRPGRDASQAGPGRPALAGGPWQEGSGLALRHVARGAWHPGSAGGGLWELQAWARRGSGWDVVGGGWALGGQDWGDVACAGARGPRGGLRARGVAPAARVPVGLGRGSGGPGTRSGLGRVFGAGTRSGLGRVFGAGTRSGPGWVSGLGRGPGPAGWRGPRRGPAGPPRARNVRQMELMCRFKGRPAARVGASGGGGRVRSLRGSAPRAGVGGSSDGGCWWELRRWAEVARFSPSRGRGW